MSEPIILSSLKNQQVKDWRALNKSREERSRQGIFLAEGEHMAMEALKTGKACALLVCDTLTARYAQMLSETRNQGIQTYLLPESVMNALSDAKTPQGVIAVCKLPAPEPLKSSDNEILVALDDVQDPGNVGTILRTLDAAGFAGLVLTRGSADPFSPKALRASMGAVFRIPIYISDFLPDTLSGLRSEGCEIMAGALHGEPFYSRGSDAKKICVVIGNEGAGISPGVLACATKRVTLPMRGGAESLNAAVACAIILYDLIRTREK